jgi:hypothetical protein
VHLAKRRCREEQVARAAPCEERGLHGEDPGRRAHLVATEVERRSDEHIPEAVDPRLGLAERSQQGAKSLVVVRWRVELRQLARHTPRRKPLAHADMPVPKEPDQARTDRRHPSVLGDHGQA